MSYPKNYQKNCTIYNKSLAYDLENYVLEETEEKLTINYTDSYLQDSTATIKHADMKTIMDSNKPDLSEDDLKDIWLPAIVSNDNFVQNKEVLLNNVIGTKTLGIEEALNFPAIKLKNWEIENNGNLDMCIDWIINTNYSAYIVEYGVLFWYKLNTIHTADAKYTLNNILPGTRVKPVSDITFSRSGINITIKPSDTIIRLSDNRIKLLTKDSSKFIGVTGRFDFNTSIETEIVQFSEISDISSKLFTIEDNKNLLSTSFKDYDLWISNGEFYSYFIGDKEKYDRQQFSAPKIPSRSYLSPSLYHIYRTIYNSLTINRIRNFDGLGNYSRQEKLKKLCYILASSPLIDRVNINYLLGDYLQELIYSEYINKPIKSTTTEEIVELLNIVAKIFSFYKKQSSFTQKQTLANNYINNKKDLFKILLNKYGGYLKATSDTTIKYKTQIQSESQLYINTNMKSFIYKDFPDFDEDNPNDNMVFNDMKIEFGDLYIESNMNPTLPEVYYDGKLIKGSKIIAGHTTNQAKTYLPLANMAMRATPEKLRTEFNKDIKLKMNTSGETITYSFLDTKLDITPASIDTESGPFSVDKEILNDFSLVDGADCLRFSDFFTYRSSPNRKNRTSREYSPDLYIQNTGLYTIRGKTSFRSISSVEDIKIYVYNNSNEYMPGVTVPTLLDYSYSQEQPVKKYLTMCANMRQIALNKQGLVWFIDTDMYIMDLDAGGAFTATATALTRLYDKKLQFRLDNDGQAGRGPRDPLSDNRYDFDSPSMPDPIPPYERVSTPKDFKITFKPNNTNIKLYNIAIEYMRDNKDEHSQCKSFYEPKLARTREPVNPIPGPARFVRTNRFPDTTSVHFFIPINQNKNWLMDGVIDYDLPEISTIHAPNIYTYGGYSQSVIDTIGVEIPFHPINVNGVMKSFQKIPADTLWNVDVADGIPTSKESGLLASMPAKLNTMVHHNYMGGYDPGIRCHTVPIQVSGFTSFEKGFLHPNSGWYSYNPSFYNPDGLNKYLPLSTINSPNISSIKKFDTRAYKSYEFDGPGFYNLRSNNNIFIPNSGYHNSKIEYKSAITLIPYEGGSYSLQDPNFGIRNLNSTDSRNQEMVDDFIVTRDEENPTEFICDYVPTNVYTILSNTMKNYTIKDIELKIKFINLTNPKNIVFALEIYNPELNLILNNQVENHKNKIFQPLNNTDITTDPMQWKDKIKTEIGIDKLQILNFIDSHKKTNSIDTTNLSQATAEEIQKLNNTRILYLYNQESLDNYSYNFSINFSDNFDKMQTFTDENKISVSGVDHFNSPVKNNYFIFPCISPTGYSEKDSIIFREIIKNNSVNLLEGSLSKIKNLPIKNTTFTLKVYVLGSDETIVPLDNTILNSQLSGLTAFDIKKSSNSIVNSICNWSIVIHTDKTSKFTTKDYLGLIDYESQAISRSGYNFIADMTDRMYMIPKVNINAPYSYIPINMCKYPNYEELSRPLTYNRIDFPSIAGYIPTFYTLVGALTEISILMDSFSRGGLSDPIIFMLLSISAQREQMDQERYFFKPIYNGAYLGVSDKALIEASIDNLHWYRMEVPILKYDNVALLTANKFNYIKLHKDIAIPLSNFYFTLVESYSQLIDEQDINFITIKNESLSGLTVSISETQTKILNEFDIVLVDKQDKKEDNGLYYAMPGSWISYPDPGAIKSLKTNKLWGNNSINKTYINDKKIIKIQGSRAYNLFDINDSLAIMTKPAATGVNIDLFTGSIEQKAILYIGDTPNTILTLKDTIPEAIQKEGFIGKKLEDSNHLIIYKNYASYNNTTNVAIRGSDNMDIGKWGMTKSYTEKNHINNNIIDQHCVSVSEGAIGYGSNKLQPEKYSSINTESPNKILDTSDILNNNINDKFKYNNITAFQYSDNTIKNLTFAETDKASDMLLGFPFRYNDASYTLDSLSNYSIVYSKDFAKDSQQKIYATGGAALTGINLENLKVQLKNSLQNNNEEYYFIDIKSNKFKTEITSISGEIFLENDFIRKIPIQPLDANSKTIILDRLTELNTRSSTQPTNSPINLNTISSIPDLQNFISTLPPDPTGCFKKYIDSTPGAGIPQLVMTDQERAVKCSGQIAQQKLSALYAEKNDLLMTLELDKTSTSGVLPYSTIAISGNQETGAISVQHNYRHHYIINIDPNQICTLSDSTTIRILKQVSYTCRPTRFLSSYFLSKDCDSVCKPVFVKNGVDENLSYSDSLVYTNNKIEEEKIKYPGIIWDDTTIEEDKEIFLSCGYSARDTLVNIKEEYIVPKINTNKIGLVKDIFNLDSNSRISIKFRNIPRKIKTIDSGYNSYSYDYKGNLIKNIFSMAGGPNYNQFYSWQCIKVPKEGDDFFDPAYGSFVEPPDFYKWMNEMIFRGFFNSSDGIEHKNIDIMNSLEPWEWIPYEYFSIYDTYYQ